MSQLHDERLGELQRTLPGGRIGHRLEDDLPERNRRGRFGCCSLFCSQNSRICASVGGIGRSFPFCR